MRGLTVRWSLEGASAGIGDQLREYVRDSSHGRFTGRPGLAFKTWRMTDAWFEGCYVFEDDAAREAFQAEFEAVAADSAGSRIIGAAPILIEPCEVVAVAEGAAGFSARSS